MVILVTSWFVHGSSYSSSGTLVDRLTTGLEETTSIRSDLDEYEKLESNVIKNVHYYFEHGFVYKQLTPRKISCGSINLFYFAVKERKDIMFCWLSLQYYKEGDTCKT